ncbi:MAG: SRPBCC family protein [Nevskia sp.]|nr:SRPBCC family protein [Nevskia sp.]
MLRNILLTLLLIVVVFFAIGFVLPDKVHVQRTAKIQAPVSQVFALVDSYREFDKWSPWSQKDPQLKVRTSGQPFGVGAAYEWTGNPSVGSGSQEIVTSTPYTEVQSRLMFTGFADPSTASFDLEPDGAITLLTWGLDVNLGHNPMMHYVGLLLDRQIGPDYEQGLQRLKALAESRPKTDFSALKAELVTLKPQSYAYVSGSTSTDPAAVSAALAPAYAKVSAYLSGTGLKPAGPPLAVTRRWDPQAKVYEFDAGIPVEGVPQAATGEVKIAQAYAGPALKVEHKGPYGDLGKTYDLLDAFKTAYALKDAGPSWEQYLNDPAGTPEAELLTAVYVPVK